MCSFIYLCFNSFLLIALRFCSYFIHYRFNYTVNTHEVFGKWVSGNVLVLETPGGEQEWTHTTGELPLGVGTGWRWAVG